MNKRTKEIVESLGKFYLEKNNNNYGKTCEEICKIGFTKITVLGYREDAFVIFYVRRPGIFIGKCGENVDALRKHLGMQIKIAEDDEFTLEDAILNAAEPEDI